MRIKPAQTSIYRTVERLLQFSVGVTERLPKSLPYRVMGERLIGDLLDAMSYIVLAFQSPQGAERLKCIEALVVSMTSVKMTYRMFVSDRKSNLSPSQHNKFLELVTSVSTQAGAWRSKQLKDIHSN